MYVSVWFKKLLINKGMNFSVLYIGMMTETNGITYNSVSL